MDLKQLEYLVAIEKYGNMSKAAEQLFITPSALNQHLLKLEKELGLPLFNRGRRHMVPTEAGDIYLRTAKQMLIMQQNTYSQIQDLVGCVTGSYHIGLTYDHGNDVFARIYPQFHKIYPGIQIRCHQLLVPEMLDLVAENELDIAFVLGGDPKNLRSDVEYIPLSVENLLLGVHRSHPLAQGVAFGAPCETIDLHLVEEEYFAVARKESTMRSELIDPLFAKEGVKLNIMIESSINGFLEQLAVTGICNAIVPQSRIRNYQDAAWFYLPGAPRFHFGIAYPKGGRLNKALQDFVALAREDAMQYSNFPAPDQNA